MVESNQDKQEVRSLQNAFWHIDYDCDGFISPNEITTFLKELHDTIDKDEMEKIFRGYSKNNDGNISCSEFVMATIDRQFYYDEDNLEAIFKRFDINNKGYLSSNDFILGFLRYGFNAEEIEEVKKDFPKKVKGMMITFEEFKTKMR